MSIEELKRDALIMSRWEKHRFLWMIAGVIVTSLFLVSVALSLYGTSGAAQLDLSRPGYQNVREKAGRNEAQVSYPANGPLDKQALESFKKMYDERAQKVTSVESYDSSALGDESLLLFSEPETSD